MLQTLTTEAGKSFPHYRYNNEKSVVVTFHFKKNNGIVIQELKWLKMGTKSVTERVTLFEGGNPHYFSKNQIIKMAGKEEDMLQVIEVKTAEEALRLNRAERAKAEKKAATKILKSNDSLEKKFDKAMKIGEKQDYSSIEKALEVGLEKTIEQETKLREELAEEAYVDSKALDFEATMKQVRDMFEERNNKPVRRDVMIKKYGVEFINTLVTKVDYDEDGNFLGNILKSEGIGGHTHYSLAF